MEHGDDHINDSFFVAFGTAIVLFTFIFISIIVLALFVPLKDINKSTTSNNCTCPIEEE